VTVAEDSLRRLYVAAAQPSRRNVTLLGWGGPCGGSDSRCSFALLAFSDCATVIDVPLAGGGVGHAISCDDPAPGWSVCTRSAEEVCRTEQYRVINQAERPDMQYIPATAASYYRIGGTVINAPAQPASERTIMRRTMVISCS